MNKIEKIKEWVKKQKKEELARNSIGVITGHTFFVDANELLSFLDTLSEEPDKVLEGEVILNGHGLLVDVTKWDNGYKLKVIIKEGEYEETIKEY